LLGAGFAVQLLVEGSNVILEHSQSEECCDNAPYSINERFAYDRADGWYNRNGIVPIAFTRMGVALPVEDA